MGPVGVGLTLEQIGHAFMPAFQGFTLAMIVGGSFGLSIMGGLGTFSVAAVLPVMGKILDN
jgi:hypothetical protein